MFVLKAILNEEVLVTNCTSKAEVSEIVASFGPKVTVMISSVAGEVLRRKDLVVSDVPASPAKPTVAA